MNPIENHPDRALAELQIFARAFGINTLESGLELPPCLGIVGADFRVELWVSTQAHPGSSGDELIELARLQAMTAALSGAIGVGFLIQLAQAGSGARAVGVQLATEKSNRSYVIPLDSPDDEQEIGPIFADGLCFFPKP